MWTSTPLILLLLVGVGSGAQPPWASKGGYPGSTTTGQISVTAAYEIHSDTTTVRVNWKGCSAEDIVVLSLDSRDLPRSYPDAFDTVELFGIVFFRSALAADSAKFSYSQSEFAKCMGEGMQSVSVYLTTQIQLLRWNIYAPGERDRNARGPDKINPPDCVDVFQILYSDCALTNVATLFPSIAVFPELGAAEHGWTPGLAQWNVKGFVSLDIEH